MLYNENMWAYVNIYKNKLDDYFKKNGQVNN